jgi:hypothetical protein
MEYILDAGRAVTCFNLIKSSQPCMNVYCQNCVIAFMEETNNFKDGPPDPNTPKTEKEEVGPE